MSRSAWLRLMLLSPVAPSSLTIFPASAKFWGDAALYFRTNDARSLAETLSRLDADRALRHAYADRAYTRARERFTTKRMIDDYLDLYRALVSANSLAA